jgi:hypothetical protein
MPTGKIKSNSMHQEHHQCLVRSSVSYTDGAPLKRYRHRLQWWRSRGTLPLPITSGIRFVACHLNATDLFFLNAINDETFSTSDRQWVRASIFFWRTSIKAFGHSKLVALTPINEPSDWALNAKAPDPRELATAINVTAKFAPQRKKRRSNYINILFERNIL